MRVRILFNNVRIMGLLKNAVVIATILCFHHVTGNAHSKDRKGKESDAFLLFNLFSCSVTVVKYGS